MKYFAGGIGITSVAAYLFRKIKFLKKISPKHSLFIFVPVSIASFFCMAILDFETHFNYKLASWAVFHANIGLALLPLLHLAPPGIIFDSLMVTASCMVGMALIAYNAPSETFM